MSKPHFINAQEAPERVKPSNYPKELRELLAKKLAGRSKKPLGDFFGLTNFGVNLTSLAPGAISALPHAHSQQDEFIYILVGTPTLIYGNQHDLLSPGLCAGFKAGSGVAHYLTNASTEEVVYLEIGDRSSGDTVSYPADDLYAQYVDGTWVFYHKDGRPY
ncbi:MAG: cupin domain-containing protein [Gammaproteobacteria bacterium]|nr:cupin domain-containing protein [Gammaproteobacteria bacterium]